MNGDFLKEILTHTSVKASECFGYTNEQLAAISRLYNVRVDGQLGEFLSVMGRCDGGMFGPEVIPLYKPSWRVREHLLFQTDFLTQMQDGGFYKYLGMPFVFCMLSSDQYYYVRTKECDAVCHFDAKANFVKEMSYDLSGFLKALVSQVERTFPVQGDLLNI